MQIRRIIPLLLILIISLVCSIYLENKYNSKVIEFSYNGVIDRFTIKELDDYFGNKNNNINLKTRYREYNLIATTGKDMYMENIKMEQGSFLIEPYANHAVIGDQVADGYFSTVDVIDKSIKINGTNYQIKGVIKDSRNIYIPFNEQTESIYWNRKTIKIVLQENDDIDFSFDSIDSFLKSKDIQIIDKIIYERKIKVYINLSIMILIYIGCLLIIPLMHKSRLNIITLWRDYISQKRRIEWSDYIKEKRKDIISNLKYLSVILLILVLIYCLISNLFIPSSMIPTNPFTLSSYIEIINGYYKTFMFHLENGFNSICIDMINLNIIMVAIFLLASKLIREK